MVPNPDSQSSEGFLSDSSGNPTRKLWYCGLPNSIQPPTWRWSAQYLEKAYQELAFSMADKFDLIGNNLNRLKSYLSMMFESSLADNYSIDYLCTKG